MEIGRDDCINLIGTQVSAQTRLPQREPEDAILRSGLRNPLQINKGKISDSSLLQLEHCVISVVSRKFVIKMFGLGSYVIYY